MNTPQEFAALHAGLQRLAAAADTDGRLVQRAALATLVQTRGPTFRRPGARMLVCGDGAVVRGLSGGCPEADIIARACEVITLGAPRLLRYDREHGLDALIELGCGGELEVLIEPLAITADLAFGDAVAEVLDARRGGWLCSAVHHDDAPCAGRRLLVDDGRVTLDTLGDNALRDSLLARIAEVSPSAPPQLVTLSAGESRYAVLVESLMPPHALFIAGINTGSLTLARTLADLGWAVTLAGYPTPPSLPAGVRHIDGGPELLTRGDVRLDARSAAVVMTHNLERDIAFLQALAEHPLCYLGAIGSRTRAAKLCAGSGLAPPRLRAPAGVDVGAETPEEIALAIATELLATVNVRDGRPLSGSLGPLH